MVYRDASSILECLIESVMYSKSPVMCQCVIEGLVTWPVAKESPVMRQHRCRKASYVGVSVSYEELYCRKKHGIVCCRKDRD